MSSTRSARSDSQRTFQVSGQFPSIAQRRKCRRNLPDPADRAKLSRGANSISAERETNRQFYDLHRDLMQLRREDSRFREQKSRGVDGAVLGPTAVSCSGILANDDDDRLARRESWDARSTLEPAPGTAARAAARFRMGNALDERIAALRRTRADARSRRTSIGCCRRKRPSRCIPCAKPSRAAETEETQQRMI